MSNKLFVSLFFLSLCIVKSSVAFSFEHPDSLQSHEPKHNSIDSLILQTSENYSCTLIHNSFSKYDVLISKPNCGYSNIYNVPGVFNYGYHAYSLYLDNAISKPLLDTGISISKLNILLGTNREQIVFLDHSQRISKNIKIEVSYHSIVSLGFLTNELSKSKSFDLDLYCTKKFYQNNFGFHYRKIDVEENGGIVEGQKTAGLTKNKFDLLAVQLNSDKSYSSINNFFCNQTIRLNSANKSSIFKLDVNTEYKKQGWSYSGTMVGNYYKNNFLDSTSTFDSSAVIDLSNRIALHLLTAKNNNSADISLGVNNDYFKIKQNSYVFYPDILSAFFRVNYRLKSFKVNAGADCNIAGDINSGDNSLFYKFNYRSKSRVLSDLNLGMLFSITSPAYIFQNLSTNHFQWENDFKKIQSQNINAEAGFFNNLIYLFGSYSNFRNYIYLNENVSPIQSEQVAGIVSVGLKWNTIFFNRIHLSGMISTQKSDAFFVRVPEFNSYSRLSYKNHFFDNALLAEIGIACLFTSSYYSDAFVPSIGQLYIQNKVKTEGYPYFNFFANFTIGSAQIYLKVEHFNNGITGGSSMVGAGYPAPPRTLKFGLIWTLRN